MTYSHCESCGFTRAKQPLMTALTCPRCRARTGKTVMLVDRSVTPYYLEMQAAQSREVTLEESPDTVGHDGR
jgi:anaerobic ribonucleoside-triphosphate reductase